MTAEPQDSALPPSPAELPVTDLARQLGSVRSRLIGPVQQLDPLPRMAKVLIEELAEAGITELRKMAQRYRATVQVGYFRGRRTAEIARVAVSLNRDGSIEVHCATTRAEIINSAGQVPAPRTYRQVQGGLIEMVVRTQVVATLTPEEFRTQVRADIAATTQFGATTYGAPL